jgi:hypothetical protein
MLTPAQTIPPTFAETLPDTSAASVVKGKLGWGTSMRRVGAVPGEGSVAGGGG